jgi:hypothetical protein
MQYTRVQYAVAVRSQRTQEAQAATMMACCQHCCARADAPLALMSATPLPLGCRSFAFVAGSFLWAVSSYQRLAYSSPDFVQAAMLHLALLSLTPAFKVAECSLYCVWTDEQDGSFISLPMFDAAAAAPEAAKVSFSKYYKVGCLQKDQHTV